MKNENSGQYIPKNHPKTAQVPTTTTQNIRLCDKNENEWLKEKYLMTKIKYFGALFYVPKTLSERMTQTYLKSKNDKTQIFFSLYSNHPSNVYPQPSIW